MPLEIVYYLAVGTSAGIPLEDPVQVEEHLSSSSSTPVPVELGLVPSDSTSSPAPISDAAEVIRSAGRTMARLAFLPTSPEDEAIVDELIRARQATKARRPISSRS